jgi:UDP-hydrolysing UDP-N-acetyl-D-glucosamine 2-epimerase
VPAIPRKVAVFTGTRADYGLLKPLARAIQHDPRAELALIVSGSHLSQGHGMTVDEIVADGLPIAATIPIWSGDDSPVAVARDAGGALAAYAAGLDSLKPDVIVLLGDRVEAFAMATAATLVGIPIVHIHGGEITEGAMDDSLRHAITKLSFLHFTSTEEHRKRVIQLGEEPTRVFNFGAPVLDSIAELDLLSPEQVATEFNIDLGARTVLMTFHPAALESLPSLPLLCELLDAVGKLQGVTVVITGTNSDIGSEELRAEIAAFVASHPDAVRYVESFGQTGYLSVMKNAALVVGNSSSTVLEAPLFGVPSVLVGDRQDGRPLSSSVIKPDSNSRAILEAMNRALSEDFRASIDSKLTVFGSPGFAAKALDELLAMNFPRPPRKRFWEGK